MELELSEAILSQLAERAKKLGVRPEDLARAAITDLIGRPSEEFEAVVDEVLAKNAELYRLLA